VYNSGVTIAETLAAVPADAGEFTARDDAERAVLEMLCDGSDSLRRLKSSVGQT